MTAPQVRGDYDQLGTIAKTFGLQASSSQQSLRRIKSQVDTLRGGDWVGQGATAFYREMDGEVLPSLKRLTEALSTADRMVRQITQILQTAETEAARIFGAGGTQATTPAGSLSPNESFAKDVLETMSRAADALGLGAALDKGSLIYKITESTSFGSVFGVVDGAVGYLEAQGRGVSLPGSLADGTLAGVFSTFSHPIEDAVGLVHAATKAISPSAGAYTAVLNDSMPMNVATGLSTGTVDTVDALVRGDSAQLIRHAEQNLSGEYGEVIRGYAIGFDALGAWMFGDSNRLGEISQMAGDGRLGPLAKFGDWLGGATYDLFH